MGGIGMNSGNGYQELKDIHRLAQEAVVEFDRGEYPERALIARIREIAGCFPRFGNHPKVEAGKS